MLAVLAFGLVCGFVGNCCAHSLEDSKWSDAFYVVDNQHLCVNLAQATNVTKAGRLGPKLEGGSTIVPTALNYVVNAEPRYCHDVVSSEPRKVVTLRDGLEVMCDTDTDGGGWIVVHRRTSGAVNFYRPWNDYKYGFGDLHSEFWLGNEVISRLTSLRRYEMRVDLEFNRTHYFAHYNRFALHGEWLHYQLEIAGYSGNAGDSLDYHNNRQFSTLDHDHDASSSRNCAVLSHGAWWYGSCDTSNLNGQWGVSSGKGLVWETVTGTDQSVTSSEMKIRPIF